MLSKQVSEVLEKIAKKEGDPDRECGIGLCDA